MRTSSQREEENEENRLSEEAERTSQCPQGGGEDEAVAPGAPTDAAYQMETEAQAPRSTITVPAVVTAT